MPGRFSPTTRAYVQRRTTQDRNFTELDARRCLKRYIARQLFRELTKIMSPRVDNT